MAIALDESIINDGVTLTIDAQIGRSGAASVVAGRSAGSGMARLDRHCCDASAKTNHIDAFRGATHCTR
jgi:hypothetical protein